MYGYFLGLEVVPGKIAGWQTAPPLWRSVFRMQLVSGCRVTYGNTSSVSGGFCCMWWAAWRWGLPSNLVRLTVVNKWISNFHEVSVWELKLISWHRWLEKLALETNNLPGNSKQYILLHVLSSTSTCLILNRFKLLNGPGLKSWKPQDLQTLSLPYSGPSS